MKILSLGDVMGRAGRWAITENLPRLREEWKLDFVVASGEKAVIEHITGLAEPKWLRLEKVTYTDGKPHYKASFLMK
ncbi:MAG: calcineurin-like phosphoesterase [Candidatus Azotimanducaceae bacterium]|jgi:calcineurin-like phosphoesterase